MADSIEKIDLTGRIDSNNAAEMEQKIRAQLDGEGGEPVVLVPDDSTMIHRGIMNHS